MEKKVIKHLKEDIKTFKEEASEDKKLIKSIKKHESKEKKRKPKSKMKKKSKSKK